MTEIFAYTQTLDCLIQFMVFFGVMKKNYKYPIILYCIGIHLCMVVIREYDVGRIHRYNIMIAIGLTLQSESCCTLLMHI